MHRTAPLVCQHLENIRRDAIKQYQDVIRHYVRHRQGIYALHRKGKLYYVGLASDLYWRLKQHLEDHHANSWDRFSVYLTIGDAHLKELESLILRIAKPAGNKVSGKIGRSENLRRRLAKDIKAIQKRELYGIIGKVVIVGTTKTKPNDAGRIPALQTFVTAPMRLRATYKGKTYSAKVRRDGTIRFNKETFTSPSSAAFSLVRHGVDGWYFWRYERAPGDWVRLLELRK